MTDLEPHWRDDGSDRARSRGPPEGDEAPVLGAAQHPSCEDNVGALLEAWRSRGQPVVYIRHDWVEPGSTLRPGLPGNDLHEVLADEPNLFVEKHVSSAFHGEPDLADRSRCAASSGS